MQVLKFIIPKLIFINSKFFVVNYYLKINEMESNLEELVKKRKKFENQSRVFTWFF